MSSQTPPAGAGTPAASGAPKVPAATPAKKWYKIRQGHDFGHFEDETRGGAESQFRSHFGIRGSDHELEVSGPFNEAPEKGKGRFSYDRPVAEPAKA